MKYLVLILILLLIPTILADAIEDITITIRLHNGTIEMRNPEYPGNNKNESFEIINGSVVYKEFSFPIIFIKNETEIIDVSLFDKYLSCLSDKSDCNVNLGKFDRAWTECLLDLESYEGENSTICKDDLDSCNLREREKDLTINSKQDKIETLEESEEDKKNTKYIYGVIGLVLGGLVIAYKYGKIGSGVKESSADEMNPQQAG